MWTGPRPQSEVTITFLSPCVCSVVDSHGPNKKFLEDMSDLALKTNCKLIICPQIENRSDRWIQVGAGAVGVAEASGSPSFTLILGNGAWTGS